MAGPGPESVLVMDNAFIHHKERIKQMCRNSGVKGVSLSLYPPNHKIKRMLKEYKNDETKEKDLISTGQLHYSPSKYS